MKTLAEWKEIYKEKGLYWGAISEMRLKAKMKDVGRNVLNGGEVRECLGGDFLDSQLNSIGIK